MQVDIINECKNCACCGICKMEDDRETIISGITNTLSEIVNTNANFVVTLSCKRYIWGCNISSVARCENRRLGE